MFHPSKSEDTHISSQYMKFIDQVSEEVTYALMAAADILDMPTIAHFQETVAPVDALDNGLDLVVHLQEFEIDYLPGQPEATRIARAIADTKQQIRCCS